MPRPPEPQPLRHEQLPGAAAQPLGDCCDAGCRGLAQPMHLLPVLSQVPGCYLHSPPRLQPGYFSKFQVGRLSVFIDVVASRGMRQGQICLCFRRAARPTSRAR